MNNEWLNTLRSRMEDHEEGVPDGLWDDIRDELFLEEENKIMAGVAPVVNDEVEKEKGGENAGYKSLFYRIGGIAAAAALVFMIVKILPHEDHNKTFSKNHPDLNKGTDRNSVLKDSEDQEDNNVEGKPLMGNPLVQNNFNGISSEKSISTINPKDIGRKETVNNEDFQVITRNADLSLIHISEPTRPY